jgi:hypothetical protein
MSEATTHPTAGAGPPERPDLLLLAIFALPMLAGLAVRWAEGDWWFNDLDAVLCGAWRSAHHLSPYADGSACPGGQPAAYMYLPQLAAVLAPLARGPDISGLRLAFGAVHAVVLSLLVFGLFLRPTPGAPRALRAPILALTSGAGVACANLAFACHALVLGAGLMHRRRPWLLMLTILAVSIVKPVFLTYLLVFAYEAQPLAIRVRRVGLGLVLAVGIGALVLATGGPELVAWRAGLDQVALARETGYGFMSWIGHIGLRGSDPAAQALYVVFAGAACLAGLAIAEVRGLSREARLMLALGVAQIVNPRLMSYDLVMLAPLAVAFAAVPERLRGGFAAAATLIGAMILVLQFSPQRELIRLGPAMLTLLLLASGALAARDGLVQRGRAGATLAVDRP